MKKVVVAMLSLLVFSCQMENPKEEKADLVPLTVDLDASLPAIPINGSLLHSESFGDPADPMLIFLHGGPGGDYQNALNVGQLAREGYFVVFYDQRGSGLSQRHDKDSYSIEVMLDDLEGVIAHYQSSDSQQVVLFGHSWGAMLAAAYLNRYPDRIDGAIFAEAGGFNKELLDAYSESSRKLSLFSDATNDVLFYEQFLSGSTNDHAVLDYKLAASSAFSYHEGNDEGIEGPSPFWRYGAVVLAAMSDIAENEGFDFTTHLGDYPGKVLFLYGGNNQSYGLDFAKREAAFFPNATIEEVPDTGHEMIYFKWETVSTLVINYLQSI